MKIIFFLLILFYHWGITMPPAFAQPSNSSSNPTRPSNNINACALGGASYFSINIEKFFLNKEKSFFAVSAGIGMARSKEKTELPIQPPSGSYFTIPASLTFNIGSNKNFFEFGIGCSRLIETIDQAVDYYVYPVIGYRFQPMEKYKLNLRVFINLPYGSFGSNPITSSNEDLFEPCGGISTGIIF